MYHFPASDIWEMDIEDLAFWDDGIKEINEWSK